MKKFTTICIVITTIIALFFLVRWINDIRPRYEWQEKIEICTTGTLKQEHNSSFAYNPAEKTTYYWCGYWLYFNGWDRCKEIVVSKNMSSPIQNITACYKKEKVRIK
jgi:hypothetical protein